MSDVNQYVSGTLYISRCPVCGQTCGATEEGFSSVALYFVRCTGCMYFSPSTFSKGSAIVHHNQLCERIADMVLRERRREVVRALRIARNVYSDDALSVDEQEGARIVYDEIRDFLLGEDVDFELPEEE